LVDGRSLSHPWPAWLALGVVILLAAAAGSCFGGDSRAPDFTLADTEGKDVSLSDLLADGPVIVDFWATWCKPCIRGFAGLQDLLDEYGGRGLSVVAISVDGPKTRDRVAPFIHSKKYGFRVLLDTDGRVARKYSALAIPRTVLVSPAGGIALATVGYRPTNHDELEQALIPLLPPVVQEAGEATQ
jgi:cytochrome c biogenesis protein CcmG/thiol:disulfide interchange protein DsbE